MNLVFSKDGKVGLFASLREYKKAALLTPLMVALEVFLEVLIPRQMSGIIDNGILGENLQYILGMGAVLVVISLVALFCGVQAGNFAAKASAGLAHNLRKDMFAKVQKFSFQNIDRYSSASLVTRMTTDVTNVQMAFMMSVRLMMRTPLLMILPLFMIWTMQPLIAGILMGILVVMGVILFGISLLVHPYFKRVFRKYDDMNRCVKENVQASRLVKAYVRAPEEERKFQEQSQEVYRLFVAAEKLVVLNNPIMQAGLYLVVLAMLYFGGTSIIGGKMQPGELTSLIIYAIQMLISVMMFCMIFVNLLIAQTSATRIVEVLNEPLNLVNPENPVKTVADGSIVFEDVSFTYGNREDNRVFDHLNLRIESGQTIGVIGGTGTGKTTLVQLIPRLYDVTGGRVLVGGRDVREYDLEVLRDQVAMVLQKNTLFTGSILENVRWGKEDATLEEVQSVCKMAQADGFIQELPQGYESPIVEGGNNVSGGQKQRLCIARALLKQPKILILDQSTSALDLKTEAALNQAFREALPDTTKIIISQRVDSIEHADRILVLEDGRIDGFGTSEELLQTNAIYQEIYASQKGGENHGEQ